jgi:hypothetical protein
VSFEECEMDFDEAVKLFSRTIFWNYGKPWPGDENKEPEFPLAVSVATPDDRDEPRTASLFFEAGEITLPVATMHPIRLHQDAENGVTDADVEFIEKLPVIIPTLLKEVDRLKAEVKKQLDHRAISDQVLQRVADACGYRGAWMHDLPDAVTAAVKSKV